MARGNPQAIAEGHQKREVIVDFVREYVGRERVAPSRAEIAAALEFGHAAVCKHITILIEDNQLEDLGGTRGLRTPA